MLPTINTSFTLKSEGKVSSISIMFVFAHFHVTYQQAQTEFFYYLSVIYETF